MCLRFKLAALTSLIFSSATLLAIGYTRFLATPSDIVAPIQVAAFTADLAVEPAFQHNRIVIKSSDNMPLVEEEMGCESCFIVTSLSKGHWQDYRLTHIDDADYATVDDALYSHAYRLSLASYFAAPGWHSGVTSLDLSDDGAVASAEAEGGVTSLPSVDIETLSTAPQVVGQATTTVPLPMGWVSFLSALVMLLKPMTTRKRPQFNS